jgi:hypothetical protein
MMRLAIVVIFLSVFSSCTKNNEENTTTADYHGKWTLVKMSGSLFNSVTTGTAMDWQEFYLFNNDGTFTKSRTRNTVKTTVSGTYTVQNNADQLYLELTYPKDSELIGSCYGNLKEELYFSANNTLSSTWQNCDGPGLDYQKIEIY